MDVWLFFKADAMRIHAEDHQSAAGSQIPAASNS
jgi:hypothetical protein